MSDDIDKETERLDFLMAQKLKRQADIIAANSDIEHKDVHVQIVPKNIFKKVQKDES